MISRMLDEALPSRVKSRDRAWKAMQARPLEGQLKMAHLATDGPLPLPPRVMPKEMAEQIAKLPEAQRAVKILAFNEDIPLEAALRKYNQYMGQQRKEEERETLRREYKARFQLISEAKTVEDLKPLLEEIVQHSWG